MQFYDIVEVKEEPAWIFEGDPQLMKWKWSFAGIYMLTDFMFMYIFNFLIAKFLVMWPKIYFYLYVEQIQLLITPLLFGQLT